MAAERSERGQLLAAGSLWRTLFVWHWTAYTRTLDDTIVDKGKGWNLSERGAKFDRHIWLSHHGCTTPLDPELSGSHPPARITLEQLAEILPYSGAGPNEAQHVIDHLADAGFEITPSPRPQG